jgi:hypothetical protein
VHLELTPGERRLVETGLLAAALLHLLVPGRLLALARVAYRLALRVEFDPKRGARRRVRLAGLVPLAAVPVVRRLTG